MIEKSKRLDSKKIVLCITGSIAAVECVKLARELKRHGAEVRAVMSKASCEILHPYAMEFATGKEVVTHLTGKIEHVTLADYDLILICPATANTISKIALGIGDTPITTLTLSCLQRIPMLIVPAMNLKLWENPLLQENISELCNLGVQFLSPRIEEGKAKLSGIHEITYSVLKSLSKKDFSKKRVLVTAGPTLEEIDDVRFISNRSSGKMGIAIAEEFDLRGAEVKLISGRTSEKTFVENLVRVESFDEMYRTVFEDLNFDAFVLTAAVSDFKTEKFKEKLSSDKGFSLRFFPNKKIISDLRGKTDSTIVGFKAEFDVTEELLVQKAKEKLKESGCDLIVANDVGKEKRGFATETNEVFLVTKEQVGHIPLCTKKEIAQKLLDFIGKNLMNSNKKSYESK